MLGTLSFDAIVDGRFIPTIILVIAMAKCQRAKILAYTRGLFNLFRNVMNYRNLRKIVCTQFD